MTSRTPSVIRAPPEAACILAISRIRSCLRQSRITSSAMPFSLAMCLRVSSGRTVRSEMNSLGASGFSSRLTSAIAGSLCFSPPLRPLFWYFPPPVEEEAYLPFLSWRGSLVSCAVAALRSSPSAVSRACPAGWSGVLSWAGTSGASASAGVCALSSTGALSCTAALGLRPLRGFCTAAMLLSSSSPASAASFVRTFTLTFLLLRTRRTFLAPS